MPVVLGIDLGKNTIPVHGVDAQGRPCLTRKLTPTRLRTWLSNLPPCRVGLEACGRAHPWGRTMEAMGHEARLIAPQFVKPFVKSNKNDRADAEAICEAVQRPNRRFVGLKTLDQPAQQAIHRARSRAVGNRTAHINEIRGLLAEMHIEMPQGRHRVAPAVVEILGNGGTDSVTLSPVFLEVLAELYEALLHREQRVAQYDALIERLGAQDERVQLLMTIPGVGPMTATALLSTMADPGVFRNGREMAAWLGLVPRQCSTGGKARLLGLSKRGDRYVRCLLVHGARSVVRQWDRKPKTDRRNQWLRALLERRHRNVATVALANRMARTAWAVLTAGQPYRENHVPSGPAVR